MMDLMEKIKITSHQYLTVDRVERISALEKSCMAYDGTSLKLELDYKLACAREATEVSEDKNEFLAWFGNRLVGFIGICSFGGSTMEVNGMVEPDFRKHGLFTALFHCVSKEWLKRSTLPMLLLTDRKSIAGQSFVNKIGAVHEHSEYEMFLDTAKHEAFLNSEKMNLRKATDDDAEVIAHQNTIYFGKQAPLVMPEAEEKRGLTIYIAEVDRNVIGKVNLQKTGDMGAIFGLGILPEFRGRGLGKVLLLKAVDLLKADGFEKVNLQVEAMNETALNLYKRCGFEVTSTMDYYEFKDIN